MKKRRIKNLVLIAVIGFFIILGIVNHYQTSVTLKNQIENSKVKLEIAQNRILDNKMEEEKDWESYDSFIQAKADAIALTIDKKGESGREAALLGTLVKEWGLMGLYICDNEIISADGVPITEHTIEKLRNGAGFDADKEIGACFYASYLADNTMIIIAQDSAKMLADEEYLISLGNALGTIKVGNSGYIVALDNSDENRLSVAYTPENSEFANPKVVENVNKLEDGFSGWFDADEKFYFVTVKDIDGYRLLAVVPKSEITHFVKRSNVIASIVFGSVMILLLFYSIFLSLDLYRGIIQKQDLKDKYRVISCVGLVAIFVITSYTWMLSAFSDAMLKLSDKLDSVEYIISQNDEKTKAIENNYEEEYLNRARRIAYTLKECPELLEEEGLVELAKRTGLLSIYVFNEAGEVEATNTVFSDFKLSTNQNDQSFEFWNIVKGYEDFIIQDLREDDTVKHNLVQYVGVKRLDSPGMVQIGISPKRLEERLYGDSLEAVLDNIAVEDKGFIFAEPEDSSRDLRDLGFIRQDNKTFLYSTRLINDKNIVVCKPIGVMLTEGIQVSAIISILCAIFILFMISNIKRINADVIDMGQAYEGDNTTAASRLASVNTPWHNLNAEGKISRLLFVVIAVIAFVVIIYVKIRGGEDNNIISYIIGRDWKKEISIFSLSYILDISIEVLFITTIIRKLILSFSVGYGARAETIGRLFNSIIKYISFIGIVFYGLYSIGVDVTTLLASAGLLTLGISLGAQSLVSDILAGMFIVFEGDFRVGDIVTIGDFRGTVREIGIRTTKIENIGNDLKIFRNSSINDIVNMTRQYSFAVVECGIEYGESIEHVESILKKELPKIKDKLPAIVDGPFYKGIVELGDSSVVVMIVAQCHENDRIQLKRDLNRQVKLIFDNNKIGIPFPQVVVHKPEMKRHATIQEHQDAETFVNEQKEKSKNMIGSED